MQNQKAIYFLVLVFILLTSCKENVEDKPFVFNGASFLSLVQNSIQGDVSSQNILEGLFTFDTELKTFNKILIDSIEINNVIYYTLLLENQNPVYNLFAIVDKNLNLILKDESLNGYLELNFKKSGSRIYAVLNEEFNSKDVVQLNRVSYYSLEQYSSDLVFRQFTKIKTPAKEAEQVVTVISDTAIITNIFYPLSKKNKSDKDVFRFDVALDKYISDKSLFDTLVYREIRSIKNPYKNPQITDAESIMRFFNNKDSNTSANHLRLNEKDFEIKLDSTWKKLGSITISNLVKKKLIGIKYISDKMGAKISLAQIAASDSAENYFNQALNNSNTFTSVVRFSDKLIDNKNIYQLYEFSCPAKKILMILETPKSTYETNKNLYEDIIQTFLVKC